MGDNSWLQFGCKSLLKRKQDTRPWKRPLDSRLDAYVDLAEVREEEGENKQDLKLKDSDALRLSQLLWGGPNPVPAACLLAAEAEYST